MRSQRLRLIWSSATVAAVFVVGAAMPAGAAPTSAPVEGWDPFPPPSAYGCQTEPGPVAQTIEYARCQTVAVIDTAMGVYCGASDITC